MSGSSILLYLEFMRPVGGNTWEGRRDTRDTRWMIHARASPAWCSTGEGSAYGCRSSGIDDHRRLQARMPAARVRMTVDHPTTFIHAVAPACHGEFSVLILHTGPKPTFFL